MSSSKWRVASAKRGTLSEAGERALAPEPLTIGGMIRQRVPGGDLTRAIADVWCEKDNGTKAIVGTASSLERRDEERRG